MDDLWKGIKQRDGARPGRESKRDVWREKEGWDGRASLRPRSREKERKRQSWRFAVLLQVTCDPPLFFNNNDTLPSADAALWKCV